MDGGTLTVAHTATVDAAELRPALTFVMQSLQRWNATPVLGMVLLRAEGDTLTLECTDLDNRARMTIPAELTGPAFSATLQPLILRDMIRDHHGPVVLSVAGPDEDQQMRITAGDLTARLRLLASAADWPAAPDSGAFGAPLSIGAAQLAKALRIVQPCISTELTRYYLNGAYLHAQDGKLRAVATDGHRMAVYDMPEVAWPLPAIILPTAALRLLCGRLEYNANAVVQISADITTERSGAAYVRHLQIAGDDWRLICKTIDGTYPDYTRVIPAESTAITVTLSHAALTRFPRSALNGNRIIKIDPDGGRMIATSVDKDEFVMPVQGAGEAFGMNIEYLKEFTRRAGIVRLRSSGKKDPFRVQTEDPHLLQIIMPAAV